jgi:hypothetical protein
MEAIWLLVTVNMFGLQKIHLGKNKYPKAFFIPFGKNKKTVPGNTFGIDINSFADKKPVL